MLLDSEILDYLYKRIPEPSSVTSSHWQEIGKATVQKINGKWVFRASGISNFVPNNFLNRGRLVIKTKLANRLLNEYNCNDKLKLASVRLAKKQGRIHTHDCVRQALVINSVKDFLSQVKCVCVIGDGYGYLGTLLRISYPHLKVVSVNLNKILFLDVYYTKKVLPDQSLILMQTKEDFGRCSMTFLRAEDYHLLESQPIDFFINVASFGEMNPRVSKQYFKYAQSSSSEKVYLYSCNREKKILPDGTITTFQDLPWAGTETMFNERPGWYQKYPISKPPFWKPLDGPMRHRLAIIKQQ